MRRVAGVICLAVLVIYGVAKSANPWQEPEDFRGLKWGSPETTALELFPSLTKVPMASSPPGSTHYALPNSKIGDISVAIGFSFLSGKFSQAYISFNPKDYPVVEAAFLERYGSPTKSSEDIVSNRMGAKFYNLKREWVGDNISIYLNKYSGSVTNGSAVLATKEYFNAWGANLEKRRKDAAKDL